MSWKAVFENPVEPFSEVGTFEHEGRSFSAGGAMYDPEHGKIAGYPKKIASGWVLQTWDGKTIVPITLVSKFRGGFGRNEMYSWRARVPGSSRTFSGRNSGEAMFLMLRAR